MRSGFIRGIFIGIDSVIYGILEQIFQLIINLANFDLFSGNVLKEFSRRIYLILGLVMVFKLILSFIQILIDPDKINDKESGVYNILKRVVISMILIVLVPSIFSFAKQLQNQVIPIIPKVVLGVPVDVDSSLVASDATTTDPLARQEDENGNVMVSTGRLMAYYSFLPFFYYNEGCEGLKTLNGTTDGTPEISSVAEAVPHVNDKNGCSTTDDGYDYNYRGLVSTLVGAYLVYVLVTVALKIAIRTIKFGLCELVAPIPIASYIDPKSSKKAFDNWVSTSVKVYLDLFTRLIVVYFIIYIFKLLFDNEKFIEALGKYGTFQGLLVALLIIIGLLNFAKEMPKFVSGMLGVPDGFTDIGDMFKGQGWKTIGKGVGALSGMVANPISSALSNYNYSKLKHENMATRLRRTAGGFFAGAGRSTIAAFNGEGWNGSYTKAKATTTANSRRRVARAIQKREAKADYRREYNEYMDNLSAYNAEQERLSSIISERRNVETQLAVKEREANNYYREYASAMQRGDKETAFKAKQKHNYAITEIDSIKEKIKKFTDEEERINNLKIPEAPVRSSQYGVGRVSAAFDSFAGVPRANSKTYHEAASWANSGKKIFNDAKAKVQEKPTLVTDKLSLKDDNGHSFGSATFSEVFSAYKDMSEGRKVTGQFAGMDRATLESVYGNALKDAAAYYVDGVADKRDGFSNNTMFQDIVQWNYKRENDIILDAADQTSLNESLASKSIGNFFKSADELGADYETKAIKYEKSERPSSDNN